MAEAQQLEEAVQSVQAQTDWGPPDQATNLCLRSLGVPYAPYAKSDRLGKIADWVGPSTRAQNNTQQSQAQQLRLRPDALTPGAGLGTGGGAASAGLQSTAGGSGASQTASSTAAVPSASSSTSAATAAAAAQGAVPSAVGVATDGSGSTAESAESEYTFVDNRPAPKSGRGWQQRGGPGAGGRGGRGGAQGGRGPQHTSGPQSGAAAAAAGGAWGAGPPGQRGAAGPAAGGRGEAQAPQGRKQQFQGGRGQGDRRENVVQYSPSVEVRPDWNVLEQVQLSQLTKLSYDVKDVEDLKMCGRLFRYNKMLDRASPRAEKRLQKFQNVQFPNPTTSDDPYIRELADNDEGSVFITDSVLATIMCATRSVFSWDVVVTKSGNKLWFDKRRKSNFDQLTVHETAQQGSQLVEGYDSINRVQPLCEEATSTNANFSQMALDTSSPVYELGEETPFVDEAERDRTAPKVFRYRRWKLEEGVGVVVRTEIDCLCELRGEEVFGLTKSVNEFDPRVRLTVFLCSKLSTAMMFAIVLLVSHAHSFHCTAAFNFVAYHSGLEWTGARRLKRNVVQFSLQS